MGIIWQWNGESSIEKELSVELLLSSNDNAYAGGVVYDEVKPIERVTFSTRGLTKAEVNGVKAAAMARSTTYTLYDQFSDSWTGYIERFNSTPILGTIYYEASVTLLIPPEQ